MLKFENHCSESYLNGKDVLGTLPISEYFVYVLHKLAKCLKNLNFSASKLYLPGYPGTLKRHKTSLLDHIFCGVNCPIWKPLVTWGYRASEMWLSANT